ncbi:hypothetical protein [Sabulibacter ruber]|uniref:hypothetical protein n=1 Tax=Sabulibacter ruber TaxID=2811901 RepID=UPI001A95BBCB|nr:hypothetical protein [Sabulibacter ruber]
MSLVSARAQEISLEKKSILNNKVSVLIPATFGVMEEEMLKFKYPSERRPTLVYTDEDAKTNLAFNYISSNASQAVLEAYKQSMETSFRNSFPTAEWIDKGVKTINGRKIGYLEVVTPAADQKVYNLIFFTDVDGKLLLGTFNCLEKERQQWQSISHQILNSVQVN